MRTRRAFVEAVITGPAGLTITSKASGGALATRSAR